MKYCLSCKKEINLEKDVFFTVNTIKGIFCSICTCIYNGGLEDVDKN